MVKSNDSLSTVYFALSDPTRRSILLHVSEVEMSIGEIVEKFKLSFAAISKHVTVLERANLIKKQGGKMRDSIIIIRDFNAPIDRVFKALINPEDLIKWHHAGDGWVTPMPKLSLKLVE